MKKLGFGLMRLPLLDTEDKGSVDQEKTNAMVDLFLERGFTYFDTAYSYHMGKSEGIAKKTLVDRYPRDSFVLASKMPLWLVQSGDDYPKLFAEQLARCGVDYFDYYLLHALGEKYYAGTCQYGGFDFMRQLKAGGKAKHIGMSFHDKAQVLDKILTEHPEIEFVQLQINYIDWEDAAIQSRQCYEVARKHGKDVLVMEPLKGGALAQDAETVSLAIRFAASLEGVLTVLSGMGSLQQIDENTSFMADFQPLSEEEKEHLLQAADAVRASIEIPCTACHYCEESCPQRIPIPDYFSLYNDQHRFSFKPLHANYYMNLTQKHGKASDCVACRQCEEHCPQHIEIAKQMKKVAAVFEAEK